MLSIESGRKRQTIRAPRRRHARVGEQLQLYTGMRTKACRLIRDDVICVGLGEVRFDLRPLADLPEPGSARELARLLSERRVSLEVNGIPIETDTDQDAFAAADGFEDWRLGNTLLSPFEAMVNFWTVSHGAGLFTGVLIRWEPAR
ncbi:ASCH domain-containing protein [Bosea sp. TAB14]|uniref:ASCH domain-containing protein n=1 Tax=Bosea sp. TAB14 TaxID=3237481 RepID=UPI003F92E453